MHPQIAGLPAHNES